MRRRALISGLAAAVLATAGCTGTSDPGATEETEGPVSLVFWSTGSDDDTAAFQAAADLYKTKNQNVTVKVQTVTWQDANPKILAAANSRSGPDIISGGLSWGIQFGTLGGMLDLREQGVVDNVKANSIQNIWPSITARGGEVYGLPLDMSGYVMLGNPDVLARAGVTGVPKTWDELTTAMEKMKAAKVKYPYVMEWGAGSWLPLFNYVRQAGGRFYSDDCSQVVINSPEAVTGMQRYIDFYKKFGAPRDAVDLAVAMDRGEVGLAQAGNWNITSIPVSAPKLKDKLIVAPMPAGSGGGATFLGGRIAGVMSYTKAPKSASQFVGWLTSDPEAIKTVADSLQKKTGALYLSNRPDQLAGLTAKPEVIKTLQDVYATAEGPPNCPGWEESTSNVDKALQKALYGTDSAKAVLDESAQIMKSNLQ